MNSDFTGKASASVDEIAGSAAADMNAGSHVETQGVASGHSLLQDAQDKLYAMLSQKAQEIDSLLHIQNESLRRAEKEREKVGVEMYSFQQRHQGLQKSLVTLQTELNETTAKRSALNDSVAKIKSVYEEKNAKGKSSERQRSALSSNLNEIYRTTRQLMMEKENIGHTLKVAKRELSKAEQDLRQKEQAKITQDLLVDSLGEEVDRLERELELYQIRINRHKFEDGDFKSLILEAKNEMDLVAFEKKKVLSQWKNALANLEKRDKNLQSLKKNIQKSKEIIMTIELEIKGFDHYMSEKTAAQDSVLTVQNKLKQQIVWAENQMEQIDETKSKLADDYDLLKRSIEVTDRELYSVEQKGRLLNLERESSTKTARTISHDIQQIELSVMREAVARSSFSKMQHVASKDAVHLRETVQQLESALSLLKNETAKTGLHCFEIERSNFELDQLANNLSSLIDEETKKSMLLEVESKKMSVELAKRQNELEVLNRKYDKIVASIEAQAGSIKGEIGPLEATIHNLQKGIQEKEQEMTDLQQRWMRNQHELVLNSNFIDDAQSTIHEYQMRKDVLERKLSKFDQMKVAEEDEIWQVKKGCKSIQSQLQRLNIVIAKNQSVCAKVSDETKELAISFRVRLRDAEKDCLKLESQLGKLKNDTQTAVQQLIEAERQFLLWQRKLDMAKQSAEALDPNYGGSEIKDLEYNLQKLKASYAQLCKQQKSLLQDISSSLDRQCDLNSVKFASSGKSKTSAGSSKNTRSSLLTDLSKRILKMEKLIEELEIEITGVGQARDELKHTIDAASSTSHVYQQRELMTKTIAQKKALKRANLMEIVALQTRHKRYEELKSGKYTVSVQQRDFTQLENELESQKQKYLDLKSIQEQIISAN